MANPAAPSNPSQSSSPSASTSHSPFGRNPLPVTARQEAQIKEIFYRNVKSKCAPEIQQFAACAHGRTFSTAWACRQPRLTMNNCMIAHDTQVERDAAREEWFANIDQRAAEREEKARKVAQVMAERRRYYGVMEPGDEELLKDVKGTTK